MLPSPAENKEPMPGQDIVIIGGGRAGLRAARRFAPRVRAVLEPRPLPELLDLGVPVIRQEGARGGYDLLASQGEHIRWVIPAAPIHFLARWLVLGWGEERCQAEPVPQEAVPLAPLVIKGEAGQVYMSLTSQRCPDDCPEPPGYCPLDGSSRQPPLYQRLAGISLPDWQVGVLRSRQMAPGLGGLLHKEMKALRDRVSAQGGAWLLATACRCHGVLEALRMNLSAASFGE